VGPTFFRSGSASAISTTCRQVRLTFGADFIERQRRDCSPRPSGQERTGDQSQRHHTGRYRGDPAGREDDADGYRPGARNTRRPHPGRSRPLGAYTGLAAAGSLGVCGPVRRPGLHRRAAARLPSSSATTVRLANSSAWALRCEPRYSSQSHLGRAFICAFAPETAVHNRTSAGAPLVCDREAVGQDEAAADIAIVHAVEKGWLIAEANDGRLSLVRGTRVAGACGS
jgi:hypothetical protein